MKLTKEGILKLLKAQYNDTNIKGMGRFGINVSNALGISIVFLRKQASVIRKEYKGKMLERHQLATELWSAGIHESQLLAAFVAVPGLLTEKQMEDWVNDFDSWDICDQVCNNLFSKTPFAFEKALAWTRSEKEFVKRAGFVMMASLAVHNKVMKDQDFKPFFQCILKEAHDERNFVKKAVNWALRQIGKRNLNLNKQAVSIAEQLLSEKSPSARWIAKDALRELQNEKIIDGIKRRLKI